MTSESSDLGVLTSSSGWAVTGTAADRKMKPSLTSGPAAASALEDEDEEACLALLFTAVLALPLTLGFGLILGVGFDSDFGFLGFNPEHQKNYVSFVCMWKQFSPRPLVKPASGRHWNRMFAIWNTNSPPPLKGIEMKDFIFLIDFYWYSCFHQI